MESFLQSGRLDRRQAGARQRVALCKHSTALQEKSHILDNKIFVSTVSGPKVRRDLCGERKDPSIRALLGNLAGRRSPSGEALLS